MDEAVLERKLSLVLPHLNERQRRVLLAAEAQSLGRGGISLVARVAKVSRPSIHGGFGSWVSHRNPRRGARAGLGVGERD